MHGDRSGPGIGWQAGVVGGVWQPCPGNHQPGGEGALVCGDADAPAPAKGRGFLINSLVFNFQIDTYRHFFR